MMVDTLGLVLAVVVHGAVQQDYSAACLVLYVLCEKIKRINVFIADSASGKNGSPKFVKATLGFVIELVTRPPGSHRFEVQPKRWIVEPTFACLGLCRRHRKDYERNPQTSEAMIYINMTHLMLKRLSRWDS